MKPFKKIDRFPVTAGMLVTIITVVSLLMGGARDTVSCQTGTPAADGVGEFASLRECLSDLYRTQQGNGCYQFTSADSLIHNYPIAASLSLAIHQRSGDLAFTSRSRSSLAKYFTYLLTEQDLDGDVLVERAVPNGDHINRGRIEDAGYNALLALDLLSLSQICVELKQPIEALFWREQANLVAMQLIAASYDSDAKFFFPYDNFSHERKRYFHSSSFMPTLFNNLMGDNIANAAIRHYLLRPDYLYPEVPFSRLTWSDGAANGRTVSSERLLKSLLLLLVLNRNGFDTIENRYHALTVSLLDSLSSRGGAVHDNGYGEAIASLLRSGGYRTLYPQNNPLFLLRELLYARRTLEDQEIIKLDKSIQAVAGTLLDDDRRGAGGELPAELSSSLQESIRTIYLTVSRLREQLTDKTIIAPWGEAEYFGADFPQAVGRLLDDVVAVLRRAETTLFARDTATAGMNVRCTLPRERVVPGETLSFSIAVTADLRPVQVRKVTATINTFQQTFIDSERPMTIVPGDSTFLFQCDVPIPANLEPGLIPVPLSVAIETASGSIHHYNTIRGAFLANPVEFSVDFPHGQLLRHRELPVTIAMKKNTPASCAVQAVFFSPAGLRIREGQQTDLLLHARQDTASVNLHIVPPQPCRPGAFPLVMKLFANSQPMGMISTSCFKHYEWIFAGPFEMINDAAARRYDPEKRIDLYDRFTSGGQTFTWKNLPEHSCAADGEILLENLMPDGGVGYLHTVISSEVEQRCALFLSSNSPLVIILNGQRVFSLGEAERNMPQRVEVPLREGPNEFLLKIISRGSPKLFFKLGDEESLASDEFSNSLAELLEGYQDFQSRTDDNRLDSGEFRKLITLSYVDKQAQSVAIIGSFNGWSPEHSAMEKMPTNRWEITLNLAPGKYTYRFLVNNKQHILDPNCSYQESDGYGGKNSVLFVE